MYQYYLASQSSINVWSLLNGCKVQTIPVSVNDQYQQSPVMCYTNNFSGAGQYTSALITSMGAPLKAFSLRHFKDHELEDILDSYFE